MEKLNKVIGKQIRDAMREKGIRQSRLSAMTGINQTSISNYVNDYTTPSREYRARIATALGKPEDYFEADAGDEASAELERIRKQLVPRLSLMEAAKMLQISVPTLCRGLQDNVFPWGYAIKGRGDHYVYVINARKFAQAEMLEI